MKKLTSKILTLMLFLAVFTSCEDTSFLNKVPYSYTSPENYYKKLSDFENALVGCYDAINTNKVSTKTVDNGTYSFGLQMILSGGNDELILSNAAGTYDYIAFGVASYNSANSSISSLWTAYFAGIVRCNYIINKAGNVTLAGNEKNRLDEIVGEAHFLRAFYYYHLAELFGGVPLNTSINADPLAPRKNIEVIYNELILPDFEYAYNVLPDRASIAGRANKWSAAGYLGVIYNYLASCKRNGVGESLENNTLNSFSWVNESEMSEKAKTILKTVIDSSGYQLIPKYDYLFRETTKAFQQQECLFTAENTLQTADAYASSYMQFMPGPSSKAGSYGIYRSTVELFKSYDNTGADIRRNYNITKTYGTATEIIEGVSYYVPAAATGSSTGDYPGKFRNSNPDVGTRVLSKSSTGISIPLLRYADILLQYAEALYFTGDEPTARNYFTQIRNRIVATGKTITALNTAYYKASFIDELLDERKRELCFESKRRIDLIRFGRITDAINSLDIVTGNNVSAKELQNNWKEYKIWLPVPQREMDLNPNLVQNTGY